MYSRLAIVLLLSGLGTAQPLPNPASYNPANQDSPGSSQKSSPPPSDPNKEPSGAKPGAGAGNSNPSKTPADPSKLAPDAPVITIDGFCDQTAIATVVKKTPSGCQSVVTREQFEQLVDALDPNMSTTFRQQLSLAIPRFLLFSKKAKEMGLEKDPRYAQMMKWDSLQTLANVLNAQMQKKADDVSESDIETYYKDNSSKFQQAELQRIFIPNSKQGSFEAASATQQDAAEDPAMKAEAGKIQAKAAAGGDFSALQREAYEATGLPSSPPNVNVGKRMPQSLPPQQRKVFDLQAGQVSELFSDSKGYYVYKVISKQLIPLAQAKDQIRNTLVSGKMKTSSEALFGSVKTELNQAYFGDPAAPAPEDESAKPASTSESAAETDAKSLDKEWADSSVRSVVEHGSDAFVPPPTTAVPLNAPVIILEGLCSSKPAASSDCQTTVTRADFEAMMNALDPKANPSATQRWADQYADWLMRGEKARQLGLADTPQYELAMSFMEMDALFKLLNDVIMERSKQLTDADLVEFYRENPRLFEEIKVERIVIPQYKAFPPDKPKPTPEQNAASHVEMKKEAESVAARAALKGADFQALENEGWKFSGYIEEPPEVATPPMLRWETWPRSRLFIFDLKVGEVSPLIDEPRNGFYVFKIVAKREVPFDEGRAYVRKRYAGERFLDTTRTLLATIKSSFDDQYFGKENQQSGLSGDPGQPGKEDTKIPSLDVKVPKKVEL